MSKQRRFVVPESTNPVNANGVSECFQIFSTQLYVSLAPCYSKTPINGIKLQHLDPLIMNYFPKAQGVVISYGNIEVLDQVEESTGFKLAKISDSSPFTFSWINVDLLVWRPQIGDTLEGYIYMQSASHIGLLVHDTFNASIKKFNIPNDWRFVPNQIDEETEDDNKFKSLGFWVDENENKIDGKIKFTIKNIHNSGKLVSVEGTLIKPGSERENQPVFRDRRGSLSNEQFTTPSNNHKKFDEEDIPEEVPHYEGSDNENKDDEEAIINESD